MKKAFSMLELVFVIVVIGILALAVISKNDNSKLMQAAVQLVAHIRYTQHLAMVDDRFKVNDTAWYKSRWTILFNKDNNADDKYAYTIFTDESKTGNPDYKEIANDPSKSGKLLSGGFAGLAKLDIKKLDGANPEQFIGTKELNIGRTYGVISVNFSSSCSYYKSEKISFDYQGRPLKGSMSSYNKAYMKNRLIQETCVITLNASEGSVEISIEPETGYVHISSTTIL